MTRDTAYRLAMILVASLGSAEWGTAQEPPTASPTGTLQVHGGDRITGHFCDCDQPDILRWQSEAFAKPFDFDVSTIGMVQFPVQAERLKAEGDYSIEMQGGDVLFGSLLGLTAEEVRLEGARFGVLHVQRKYVRSIQRWQGGANLVYAGPSGLPEGESVYTGPNGLQEWEREHPQGAWRQEANSLTTNQAGALLARNFDLPAHAAIEFELSWTSKPDFIFALGARRHGYEHAFRIEVWDDELVLLREAKLEADVASLGEVTTGEGSCHLMVYLDQERSRATVFSPEGRLLGEVDVAQTRSYPESCIRLVNLGGKLRLELLRVMQWDGILPHEVHADKARLHRTDGSVVLGEVQVFDTEAGEFLVGEGDQAKRIRADDVARIVMSPSEVAPAQGICVICQDGTRLSGRFHKVENGRVWLNRAGVEESLGIPVAELRQLIPLGEKKPAPDMEGRVGRLVMENVSIQGRLAEGDQQSDGCCLAWQPVGSVTASTFAATAAARIVYRAPPSEPGQPSERSARPPLNAFAGGGGRVRIVVGGGGLVNVFAQAFAGNAPNPRATAVTQPIAPSEPCLYLKTGDAIPCEVKRIDKRGVTFESPIFDATFACHDKVKAVELENRSLATKIDPSSRDRLITLPRMKKDNPPTHLIRSIHGDYLRGRLVEMDEETVTVEVRLDTRKLPREQVTRIIWLGEEASNEESPADGAEDGPSVMRVQALRDDGIRLTFDAEKLVGNSLEGTSDVLGTCRVDLDKIDQLMIGGAIEQAAPDLPYQRWKLRDATLPKFAQGDGKGGSTPGMESALVGEPAPDFELATLDGSKFRLRDHRGKVVVLEFWASWCGPCIATLPQIDRTVKEFEDRGVMLVAVNLQETSEAVTEALERLDLRPTVALDRSGTVAEQYAAVAIPQTVIIDGDGKVARLFVGGGRQYEQQLREALQAVLPTEDQEELITPGGTVDLAD